MIADKELPQIDIPENWIVGTDITKELLSMYANYPVRLKCEIFAFIADGEVDVLVNTNRYQIRANEFATLLPGSIFQINEVKGNIQIYFLGFSSQFVNGTGRSRSLIDTMLFTLGRPIISLKPVGVRIIAGFMNLLIDIFEHSSDAIKEGLAVNAFEDIHKGISLLYKDKGDEKVSFTKGEQICRMFSQLVIQHYSHTRNVTWYAQQLQITHAHLCTVVKQVSGRTCIDIISSMVIMDAKSQLKSTNLSIQAISDSLHFANMSFFGKYFKRYVGMSPLEYRNNG